MVNGVLNIDKPEDMTSHDVVQVVRRLTGQKRVGHAGTLDPFATGVLVVALGSATRLIEYTRDLPKTYEAVFMLGATSDTDDVTGSIVKSENAAPVTRQKIETALQQFIGTIEQIPPAYSAVKYKGKKLYEVARASAKEANQLAQQRKRQVTIHSIDITKYEYPQLHLTISCGSGTYIRSLARDLGEVLECGAHVQSLRRTAIGDFTAETSASLARLNQKNVCKKLISPESLVTQLPRITIPSPQATAFQQGKQITLPSPNTKGPVAVFSEDTLLGIGNMTNGLIEPQKVLHA